MLFAGLQFPAMKHKDWKKVAPFLVIVVSLYLIDFSGLVENVIELDYARYFRFDNETLPAREGAWQFATIHGGFEACSNHRDPPYLLMVIKSKIDNAHTRSVIRRTWGRRVHIGNVSVSRVFSLGASLDDNLMDEIRRESSTHNDIVQTGFIDAYFNNTLKTIAGIRWAAQHCASAKFVFFVDDDYYVSVLNLLRFIAHQSGKATRYLPSPPPNDAIFAGYVMQTAPHRHKFSKWYLSLAEYPYNTWPPYVTGGAFVLSRSALQRLEHCIGTTPHFRFDDVFVSLSAMKAGITLTHCPLFYFQRPHYSGPESYKHVIASHGFKDSKYMERVWQEYEDHRESNKP